MFMWSVHPAEKLNPPFTCGDSPGLTLNDWLCFCFTLSLIHIIGESNVQSQDYSDWLGSSDAVAAKCETESMSTILSLCLTTKHTSCRA